jgi:hypothetical protein
MAKKSKAKREAEQGGRQGSSVSTMAEVGAAQPEARMVLIFFGTPDALGHGQIGPILEQLGRRPFRSLASPRKSDPTRLSNRL